MTTIVRLLTGVLVSVSAFGVVASLVLWGRSLLITDWIRLAPVPRAEWAASLMPSVSSSSGRGGVSLSLTLPMMRVTSLEIDRRRQHAPQFTWESRRDWVMYPLQYRGTFAKHRTVYRDLGFDVESYTNKTLHARYATVAVTFPYWFSTLTFAILPAWWLARCFRRRRLERIQGRCATCGYDLRATPDRCPECGSATPNAATALHA